MMTIDHLADLAKELKRLGCGVRLTMTVNVPFDAEEQTPAAAITATAASPPSTSVDEPPKATIKTRMHVLNQLHAAPGQPNRELVRRFLWHRGWLGGADQPEEWNLDHVPISNEGIKRLTSEVQQFAEDERKPTPQ